MRMSEFWTLSSRPMDADILGSTGLVSIELPARFLQPHNRPLR